MGKKRQDNIMLFDLGETGHRPGYLHYLASIYAGKKPSIVYGRSLGNWFRLAGARKVVLSSADHYPIFATSIGLFRKLSGKSSIAVYIAAEKFKFSNGIVPGTKYCVLRLAKLAGLLRACSITPFDLEPRLRRLCCSWVYDLQFCARNHAGTQDGCDLEEAELLARLKRLRDSKREIIILLGNLSRARGLREFFSAGGRAANQWIFVLAGSLACSQAEEVDRERSENLIKHTKRVSEDTFARLLDSASLVWCYFHPPYDQNSGLFCNAVRAGKAVMVRKGSYLHRFGVRYLGLVEVPGEAFFPPDAIILKPASGDVDLLRRVAKRNEEELGKLEVVET